MYPPFTPEEVAQVEREVLAWMSTGVPHRLDVTGHMRGEVVEVFRRGEYPYTEVCSIIRGAFPDATVGYAYPLWDHPDDPGAPYEFFETLDDFTGDLIDMHASLQDEAIGTTALDELGPADANGVHWL
jgi:hypothetical protein